MDKIVEELRAKLDIATGHAAAMNLMVAALMAQAPDKARLLKDFSEMSDDTTVRSLNSTMSEHFFQAVGGAIEVWRAQIEEAAEDDKKKNGK